MPPTSSAFWATRFNRLKYRLEKLLLNNKFLRVIMMDKPSATDEEQQPQPDILVEGKAKILIDKKNIFYNPVQEFNRDLSIAVLTQYTKERRQKLKDNPKAAKQQDLNEGLRIIEALSATGLRSIRYAKEIPGVTEILANDIAAAAVEAIQKNVTYNGVGDIVKPNHDDATMAMYLHRKHGTRFDVVDLDPYGCPTPFLDSAVQCVKDDGILLVTATDMAVLAGNCPETCYVKYGALSLKNQACHEMALRILLQNIAGHAARYGRAITPVLSISVDFYIRVFVKIHRSQAACKLNATNLGLVYQCTACESTTVQPLAYLTANNACKLPQAPAVDRLCDICKQKFHMGGPIWTGALHDKDFVGLLLNELESKEDNHLKTLSTLKRILGVLHVINEELDTPLYYQLDRLMSVVRSATPPMMTFRSALLNAGYKVSYSHAHKLSVKTNAPNHVIWDIIRAWVKDNPVKREKFGENKAGLNILDTASTTEVSFAKHKEAVPFSQEKHLVRYQHNPKAFWGPGTRGTTIVHGAAHDKQARNQNKKRRRKESGGEDAVEEKKRNVVEESV